jgi:cytochrome b6-f complex iron-sulfur subunit
MADEKTGPAAPVPDATDKQAQQERAPAAATTPGPVRTGAGGPNPGAQEAAAAEKTAAVAAGAVPTGRNDLAPPPGVVPDAPKTAAAPAAPPPPRPAPVVAAPANPDAVPASPEVKVTPGVAPSGSPPMTPITPGGPPPSTLPQPRSNTIGPGVRESLEKKPAADESASKGRRNFLKWSLPIGWVAFSGACASSLVATARFLFPNVLFEPPQSFKIGFPGEYNVGEVDTRFKDAFGVWVVREPQGFYALIAVCTHLGCSPNWLAAENKFKCPCHGSGFYRTGVNFEGPAPRPLERARIVLADDGQILVDKSVKFQQEKGEWDNAEAFLKA